MSLLSHPLRFENIWVRSVDDARRPASAWLTVGVAAITAIVAVLSAQGLATYLAALSAPPSALLLDAAATATAFGLLWFVALGGGWREGRGVWLKGAGVADAGLGAALGGGGYLVAVGLVALSGRLAWGSHGDGMGAAWGVLVGLALVALQASAEEVFFRGWLQPVLCARWGVWVGVIATALLFAGLHVAGGARSLLTLLNLALGGLAFGLLALRSGGLWAPAMAHFAWNGLEACGLGLDVNPGVGPTGSVLDLDIVGSGAWSGGADGMNGSVALTLVLGLGVAALAMTAPRRIRLSVQGV